MHVCVCPKVQVEPAEFGYGPINRLRMLSFIFKTMDVVALRFATLGKKRCPHLTTNICHDRGQLLANINRCIALNNDRISALYQKS